VGTILSRSVAPMRHVGQNCGRGITRKHVGHATVGGVPGDRIVSPSSPWSWRRSSRITISAFRLFRLAYPGIQRMRWKHARMAPVALVDCESRLSRHLISRCSTTLNCHFNEILDFFVGVIPGASHRK
jgi:hypothetical protein